MGVQNCKSKKLGGLGVKGISLFNEALLGKWRWNLFHSSPGVWCVVLSTKYDGWHGLLREERSSLDSLWSRDLKRVCDSLNGENWFDRGIWWKVGVRDKIGF